MDEPRHLLPVPMPNADTRPYWDACAREQLLFQRCRTCDRPQFYPRSLCAHCQSSDLTWQRSAGRGAVYTCSVVHRAPSAAFRAIAPYVLALIDMDEGFRMMTNIVDCEPAAVAIGMRIRIVFEPRGENGFRIPQARPEQA